MIHPQKLPLPLELLIQRLRSAGIYIDPARQLRLLRLFKKESGKFIGDEEVFQKIKLLLTPFLARTAKEQSVIYEVIEQLEKEWKDEELSRVLTIDEEKFVFWSKFYGFLKKYAWLLALALSVCLVGIIYQLSLPKKAPLSISMRDGKSMQSLKDGYILREDSVFEVHALSNDTENAQLKWHWRIYDLPEHKLIHQDSSGKILQWKASKHGETKQFVLTGRNADDFDTDSVTLRIHCANPPKLVPIYPPGPYLAGEKLLFKANLEADAESEWIFNETDTLRGARVTKSFNQSGAVHVRLNVWRKNFKGDCYNNLDTVIAIDVGKPFLATVPIQKNEPRYILQIKWFWWVLAVMLLLWGLFLLRRWWEEYNMSAPVRNFAELEAAYPLKYAAPYYIPYLPQEGKIAVPRDFFRIAEVLSRRESGLRRNFDVTATVQATIEAGGFPSWRETPQTRPTEYLFIVTRVNERQQSGRLFERLCLFMHRRDVPMEVWFHDGRFELLRNPDHPEGINLVELNRRFPYHRLILLGDALGLIDSDSTQLRSDLEITFRRWPRRLLLTPEAVSGWQFQEECLHKLFLTFPANTEGVLDGLELLDRTEEYEAGRFQRWRDKLMVIHCSPSQRYRKWENVQQHFEYLDAEDSSSRQKADRTLRDWLCALAVSPQPDWALTIALGQAIGAEVTHDRLLALTNIPWLNTNKPDTALRLELLRHLSEADEKSAREAFARELEAVREETENGFAEGERRAHLALQQFALDPLDPVHKKLLSELKGIGLLNGSHKAELQYIYDTKVKPVLHLDESDIFQWLETPVKKAAWTPKLKLAIFFLASGIAMLLACRLANQWQAGNPKSNFEEINSWWFDVLKLQTSTQITQYRDEDGPIKEIDSLNVNEITRMTYHFSDDGKSVACRVYYNRSEPMPMALKIEALNNSGEVLAEALSNIVIKTAGQGRATLVLKVPEGIKYFKSDSINIKMLSLQTPNNQILATWSTPFKWEWPIPSNRNAIPIKEPSIDSQDLRLDAIDTLKHDTYQDTATQTIALMVSVYDKDTKVPIGDALTKLFDLGQWLPNGNFLRRKIPPQTPKKVELHQHSYFLSPNHQYKVVGSKMGYTVDSTNIIATNGMNDAQTLEAQLYLRRGVIFKSYTINRLNNDTLYGVTYRLLELPDEKKRDSYTTLIGQDYNTVLDYEKRYRIIAFKAGFTADSIDFSTIKLPKVNFQTIVKELRLRPLDLSNYLPFALYFDNDEPDKRTMSKTTKREYRAAYVDYFRRKEAYIAKYTEGLAGQALQDVTDSMDVFFERDVRGGWNRLMEFSEVLYDMLTQGDQIEITLKGYTSPRGASNYNKNLSERRISSVYNHFDIFDGGIYKRFIDSGQLVITIEANGESKAPRGLSDNIQDERNSIYSTGVARENRVEIFGVRIK